MIAVDGARASARATRPEAHVGAGTAVPLAHRALARGPAVMVVDAHVESRLPGSLTGAFAARLVHSGRATVDSARHLAALLERTGARSLFIAGGGSVIDVAKLAVASLDDSRLLGAIARHGRDRGVMHRGAPGSDPSLFVAPTTVGTGAESSTGLVVEVASGAERFAVLVVAPATGIEAIAFDEDLLRLPDPLLRDGVYEAITRVAAAVFESPSSLPLADREAYDLLTALGGVGRRVGASGSDDGRQVAPTRDALAVDAALLSSASHSGWALAGRGFAPSSAWFIATELSMALGVRKAAALGLVFRPYLDEFLTPARAIRLQSIGTALGVAGGPSAIDDALTRLLAPEPVTRAIDAEYVADRVMRRFGRAGPLNTELSRERLMGILTAAETRRRAS
ncbi:iron-containing alcohol dehydrogenase [Agromyces atrinae]|uniref:iron-containing alcohol dehydrogenase n=1 Tax=Agromyces atrinae TaxID=592376 RepID=UPI001F5718A8|nr:iron-containing alcohol dehydrogenase [Agromyces atrinae]MCI2957681.1 iron-containing alcohol dehydrogenase [Agromyces atrinae]